MMPFGDYRDKKSKDTTSSTVIRFPLFKKSKYLYSHIKKIRFFLPKLFSPESPINVAIPKTDYDG